MTVPSPGLALPAVWCEVIRGDCLAVRLPDGRRVLVELLDCRSPSPATPDGQAARHWLEAWLEASGQPLTLWLSMADGLPNLLARLARPIFTARVWAGSTDLAAALVAHGHAQPISQP
jgi:endonuclease YncB( thermonuclease family)